MSERDLRGMIDYASGWAEKFFAEHGAISALYHIVTADGEDLVMPKPMPNNKDASAALVKAYFETKKVVRYVYIDEAWFLEANSDELTEADHARFASKGLGDEPNRREAIMFVAEDRERQMTARRVITRVGEKAELGPLIVDDDVVESSGRMMGMLRPAGAMQ